VDVTVTGDAGRLSGFAGASCDVSGAALGVQIHMSHTTAVSARR
jgi:hypothetical protein